MNVLKNIALALLAIILVAQTCILTFGKGDTEIETPPPPLYGVIGNCVDISDFIKDVEVVNGISCDCIILDGEIIYFDVKSE